MARTSPKTVDITTIEAREKALREELAALAEQKKVAELTARDAGRPVLLAALDRIKIPSMEKTDARSIASAISTHGAEAVAQHLATIPTS
ncbi:hypothetical protein [Sphingomonas sp. BK481]|uniref:hypothetical protein n=1 Tax=Sphingomonas sp. BK481 TaxID=2586981 RepID=UPI0016089AE8|nr:hypothetical protein [Sphingomonas sp. BK481]MBB3588973.1 hypothetical protein [Sphingomonas sp. BK481]